MESLSAELIRQRRIERFHSEPGHVTTSSTDNTCNMTATSGGTSSKDTSDSSQLQS